MKRFCLLVVAFVVINSTCEAAKWKIKSPKSGARFDFDSNIPVTGKGPNKQQAEVGAGFADGGKIYPVASMPTRAAKRRWAVTLESPFDRKKPDVAEKTVSTSDVPMKEPEKTVVYVAGETNKKGIQEDLVEVVINYEDK